MSLCKAMSAYLAMWCLVVLCAVSQAKPVVPSSKLLHALGKQHSNSESVAKLDKALLLRDLLYPPKTYQASDNEARPVQDSASQSYSPLELLQALADYESNDDYYQDQANADGLYYTDGQDGWFDGPILPKVNTDSDDATDEQLNKLLINYLYDHYSKMNGDANDEDDDSNVEKRRQKVVIKEDLVGLTTPSTPAASTESPRKAKLVYKPRHGQKEVPLLRPANAAESKQKDWPEELEENNLDEEGSLKEMRSQSRPVRDVLTSQLDSLKAEAQAESGAATSSKH